jgi:hypothetical protein
VARADDGRRHGLRLTSRPTPGPTARAAPAPARPRPGRGRQDGLRDRRPEQPSHIADRRASVADALTEAAARSGVARAEGRRRRQFAGATVAGGSWIAGGLTRTRRRQRSTADQ